MVTDHLGNELYQPRYTDVSDKKARGLAKHATGVTVDPVVVSALLPGLIPVEVDFGAFLLRWEGMSDAMIEIKPESRLAQLVRAHCNGIVTAVSAGLSTSLESDLENPKYRVFDLR